MVLNVFSKGTLSFMVYVCMYVCMMYFMDILYYFQCTTIIIESECKSVQLTPIMNAITGGSLCKISNVDEIYIRDFFTFLNSACIIFFF